MSQAMNNTIKAKMHLHVIAIMLVGWLVLLLWNFLIVVIILVIVYMEWRLGVYYGFMKFHIFGFHVSVQCYGFKYSL
jgi:hypothetical protein